MISCSPVLFVSKSPGYSAGGPMADSVMRVLVVDDEVDTAELLAESLRLNGIDVVVAHTAVTALKVIKAFAPEVALLDVGLPDIDGYELAREIAASGVACKLIAITGYSTDDDRARALAAGFTAFLVKPVRTAALLWVIGESPRGGLGTFSEPVSVGDAPTRR
jgi:DNA-binding response OmpR family regulator